MPHALSCNQGNCFPGQPQGNTAPGQEQAPSTQLADLQNLLSPWGQQLPGGWPWDQNGNPVPAHFFPVQPVLQPVQPLPAVAVTQAPVVVTAAPVVVPSVASGGPAVNNTANRILDDEDDDTRRLVSTFFSKSLNFPSGDPFHKNVLAF